MSIKPDFFRWRQSLRLTQEDAAALFGGITTRTWQNWERWSFSSSPPARVLLWVLHNYPDVQTELLRKLRRGEKL